MVTEVFSAIRQTLPVSRGLLLSQPYRNNSHGSGADFLSYPLTSVSAFPVPASRRFRFRRRSPCRSPPPCSAAWPSAACSSTWSPVSPRGGGGGRSHRGEGGVVVLWAGPISYGRGQWEGVSGNVEPEGAWLGWVGVA